MKVVSKLSIGLVLLFLLTLTKNVKIVLCERVLASPHITDWGTWGTWEYCPVGTFVTGMQLLTQSPQGMFYDDRSLTGIRLFCNTYGGGGESNYIESNKDTVGDWGKTYFCSRLMTGFQLRSERYQSALVDDSAGNNLRMFCDAKDSDFVEGDGNSFGRWTAKRLCGPKEAVCGIITQIDDSGSWDSTGLNNVMMKCCDLPHPLKTCKPVISWKLVSLCHHISSNTTSTSSDPPDPYEVVEEPKTFCNYTRKVGISYADGLRPDLRRLNEEMGYGLSKMKSQFQYKFLNLSEHRKGSKDVLDGYWLQSPSYVWEPQTMAKARISAVRNGTTSLYQLHGECGMFQVWGTKLRRVDTSKTGGDDSQNMSEKSTTTVYDFTNDAADDLEYLLE